MIDRSWLIHKSRGIKPDWLGDFLIIFRMSSLVKCIVDSNLCAFFENCEGRSLFVFARKSCFAKKLLNVSAFSLKFVINLLSLNTRHCFIIEECF